LLQNIFRLPSQVVADHKVNGLLVRQEDTGLACLLTPVQRQRVPFSVPFQVVAVANAVANAPAHMFWAILAWPMHARVSLADGRRRIGTTRVHAMIVATWTCPPIMILAATQSTNCKQLFTHTRKKSQLLLPLDGAPPEQAGGQSWPRCPQATRSFSLSCGHRLEYSPCLLLGAARRLLRLLRLRCEAPTPQLVWRETPHRIRGGQWL